MFLWPKRETDTHPAAAGAAAGLDAEQMRVLRLMVTDTQRWRCDWAAWRIRFGQDHLVPGMTPAEIADFVRRRALALCTRAAEAQANILYLRDEDDLVPVFAAFGALAQGPGHIAAIQSRDAYDDAARIVAVLTGRQQAATGEEDALAMPDMQWHVTGTDQFRVARTRANGHVVTVRFGHLGGHEMWVVDVDGEPGCAHFRTRADAMSKLGVGVALESYRARSKR